MIHTLARSCQVRSAQRAICKTSDCLTATKIRLNREFQDTDGVQVDWRTISFGVPPDADDQ